MTAVLTAVLTALLGSRFLPNQIRRFRRIFWLRSSEYLKDSTSFRFESKLLIKLEVFLNFSLPLVWSDLSLQPLDECSFNGSNNVLLSSAWSALCPSTVAHIQLTKLCMYESNLNYLWKLLRKLNFSRTSHWEVLTLQCSDCMRISYICRP